MRSIADIDIVLDTNDTPVLGWAPLHGEQIVPEIARVSPTASIALNTGFNRPAGTGMRIECDFACSIILWRTSRVVGGSAEPRLNRAEGQLDQRF